MCVIVITAQWGKRRIEGGEGRSLTQQCRHPCGGSVTDVPSTHAIPTHHLSPPSPITSSLDAVSSSQ